MSLRIAKRSAALAAAFTILASAVAFADTVGADGDRVEPGGQTLIDLDELGLGPIGPGQVVDVEVDFLLKCQNGSHPNHGATVSMALSSAITQEDGSVTVTPGTIGPIPTTWPVDGVTCSGSPTLASSSPAIVHVTAPTVVADDYLFTVIFRKVESDETIGTTGSTAITMEFDVVANTPPVDTTDPVLADVPADRTVTTAGDDAVVSYPMPTATDDMDPSPSVVCTPASGTTFQVGTTPVTCTATDASGNSATASFMVTVVRVSALFEQPVGNGGTFTVGSSRTIPIKVSLFSDGEEVTTGEAWVWLGRCGGSATKVAQLERQTGRWMGHLDTSGLIAGCYQVTVRADGVSFGGFELRIDDGASSLSGKPTKTG